MIGTKNVFRQYADFDTRARRSEYWYFYLANFIIGIVLNLLFGRMKLLMLIPLLYSLFVLIPGIAVGVRRLHDTGRSGWWLFIALVPLVGIILLIVWFCTDSQMGENEWGPNPKEIGNSQDFVNTASPTM